jgi:hypothetical protein
MDRGLHSSSLLFVSYFIYSQLECIYLYNKFFLLKKNQKKKKKQPSDPPNSIKLL